MWRTLLSMHDKNLSLDNRQVREKHLNCYQMRKLAYHHGWNQQKKTKACGRHHIHLNMNKNCHHINEKEKTEPVYFLWQHLFSFFILYIHTNILSYCTSYLTVVIFAKKHIRLKSFEYFCRMIEYSGIVTLIIKSAIAVSHLCVVCVCVWCEKNW